MKVSIKYKLPFFIAVAFFLFWMLLFLYYRLFLMQNLGQDFDLFKDHLYQISEDINTKLKTYYPDRQKLASYLEEVSIQENIKITIYDVKGNKFLGADHHRGYGLNVELKNFTVVGRNVIYVIELVYPFSIENLGQLHSFKKIRDAALVLLLLLVILLIIYLQFSFVRPLTQLNQGLATLNYRRPHKSIQFKRNDELGELASKFEEMQRRLQNSYRQQTEMMASISHDLKTPLTSISGFLERMMEKELSEERQAEYLQIIYQKAQDIRELLSEFNEYVNSDLRESQNTQQENVNMKQFFKELCTEYDAELAGNGIGFQAVDESGHEGDVWLIMDRQQIRRIFANLVSNSLKYADKMSKIRFLFAIRDEQAVFSVEDNGPGVPPAELDVIFEKFYRIDKSRSREKGGSGLGLAICQRIVESHAGQIWAYLTPEGGLGISFTLPLKQSS